MTAKIGTPRLYPGNTIPVLYPGEQAQGRLAREAGVAAADGVVTAPVIEWLVEPMPGWYGWWLRWRYRLWGRWWSGGPPNLEVWMGPLRCTERRWTVNADDALREITRIIQDQTRPTRKLDRIYRVLVQVGAIQVKP